MELFNPEQIPFRHLTHRLKPCEKSIFPKQPQWKIKSPIFYTWRKTISSRFLIFWIVLSKSTCCWSNSLAPIPNKFSPAKKLSAHFALSCLWDGRQTSSTAAKAYKVYPLRPSRPIQLFLDSWSSTRTTKKTSPRYILRQTTSRKTWAWSLRNYQMMWDLSNWSKLIASCKVFKAYPVDFLTVLRPNFGNSKPRTPSDSVRLTR